MEAVGLAASIITLIGAATLTSSSLTRLWALRGTPLYVVTALNEVNDFKATLILVQSALQTGQASETVSLELSRLLDRAKERLEAFDQYLKDEVLKEEYGTHNVDHPKLRRRAKLKEIVGQAQQQIDGLQQGLLSIKMNLVLVLSVAQLQTMPKLFTNIQEVSVVHPGDLPLPLSVSGKDVRMDIERVATLYSPITRGPPASNALAYGQPLGNHYVKLVTKPITRMCQLQCPCQCHKSIRAVTPRWLQGLIGTAFVNFTGTPVFNQRSCNIKSCESDPREEGSARFQYYFPAWLLSVGIELTASWRSVSGIGGSWSLKIPQTIRDPVIYNKLLWTMQGGSLLDLRRTMNDYHVRPFDRFHRPTTSCLFNMAVTESREDVCLMLLECGADLDFRGSNGLTPAEYFWLKSLKSKFFLTVQNHPMLDEARDHLGLTPMHNLVLDGRISLLKHQLECEPHSVSFKDTWGATPLHWAARCADIQAISLLLSYGADVNAVCKRGRSILHWTFNPECCKAIIEAGANVDLLDDNGESVLVRCFDFFQVPEALIDVLLEAGVNVNSKSNSATTALMQAVITASSHICDRLMSYGADTEIRNLDGCTPIYSAIWYNNHSNIRLLMDRGASLTSLDNHGRSIVQYAAVWADLETMDILRRARIKGLCMNACVIKRSWDWFSHRDTFFVGERAPQNQEVAAFQALLDSVVPAADTPAVLAVEDLRIPGAFFIEPSNEMEA